MRRSELDFDFRRASAATAGGATSRLPILLALLAAVVVLAFVDRDWTGSERRRIDDAASKWRDHTRTAEVNIGNSPRDAQDAKDSRLLELRWVPRLTELENCVAAGHQLESIDVDAEAGVTTVVASMDKVELLQDYVECLNAGLDRATWTVQAIGPASSADLPTAAQQTNQLRATLRHREPENAR